MRTDQWPDSSARGLALRSDDRILALGADGWLGRTFHDIAPEGLATLRIASRARADLTTWDADVVRRFEPTLVVNAAFLTPSASRDQTDHARVNAELTGRFEVAAGLPSVRAVVTVSSGASVVDPQSAYGAAKRVEEAVARAAVTPERSVVIARAYSLSGRHVRRPHDYAFSDLILQAPTGKIRVHAEQPVFRRFTGAQDLLRVCLAHALAGWSGAIESGGELVEIGQLAQRVARIVNPAAVIERRPWESASPSIYASDGTGWEAACRRVGHVPADLDAQISAVAAWLT